MRKRIKEIKDQILQIKFDLSFMKTFLVLVLFLFCAAFGVIMFFIGEKIKNSGISAKNPSELEIKINKMVSGHPIQDMTLFIAQNDKEVAAFLVAIAKKESNWGKNSPKKNGRECYNYWGYRGRFNQTDSGYSCFRSPEQAVNVVGGRIGDLINQKINTPGKMVLVWKCGWDCSGHDSYGVKKWVSDVNYYFKKISYQ